jgi:hypothetical protein
MKILIATVALAAAVATPALAQTRMTVPYSYDNGAASGYGYVAPWDRHAWSSNPANDVYDTRGRYIGSDPDPFIRDQLARGHGR